MTGFDERRISIHHAVSGMDATALRTRISGLDSVSRAWVDRVKQRRREYGEIALRKQQKFRRGTWSAEQEQRLVVLVTAKPDATLAELRTALLAPAALSTIWRVLGRLGLTSKRNRTRRRTTPA